jgi:hypothetical protein
METTATTNCTAKKTMLRVMSVERFTPFFTGDGGVAEGALAPGVVAMVSP